MSENPAEKFYRLMSMRGLTSVILTGHLLIEEELQAVIDEHVKNPKVLEIAESRFSFYHRMTLVRALIDEKNTTTWTALRKLNSLRNRLAHNLEPGGLEERIDDLIAYLVESDYGRIYSEMDRTIRLRRALAKLYGRIWQMRGGSGNG